MSYKISEAGVDLGNGNVIPWAALQVSQKVKNKLAVNEIKCIEDDEELVVSKMQWSEGSKIEFQGKGRLVFIGREKVSDNKNPAIKRVKFI